MKTINNEWQLQNPIDAITFDCDSTISAIEGIDELAKINQVGEPVQQLTEEAMAKSGLNEQLYQQRLDMVRPTRSQTLALGESYFIHKTPDVIEVIQLLQTLHKSIYILSAGLYPSIAAFGKLLNIQPENVLAVDVYFDEHGNYLDFDHNSPLITNDGKRVIGAQLKQKHARMIHIGDGLNDYSIQDLLVRFIGFGGICYRERVAKLCQYYLTAKSMAAILPLCLTDLEIKQLSAQQMQLYEKGLAQLKSEFPI